MLLPWYATGQLDEADLALMNGHLAECAECREALAVEQAMERRVAVLSLEADLGWVDLRDSLAQRAPSQRWRGLGARLLRRPALIGLAFAAQAFLLVTAIVAFAPITSPAPYHALSATSAPTAGNAILMFRSDAKVNDVMRTLEAADTRIVDGPTSAGAWIVRIDPGRRSALLSSLRAQPIVTMAEPTDP